MSQLDSPERLKELYLPSDKEFVLVDVPDLQYVMIDGEGNPESGLGQQTVKWLFSVIYPVKLMAKKRMGKKFVEPPLEGLWWADDMKDFISGNRDKLKWRMMIVTPDWMDNEMLEQSAADVKKKLGDIPNSLRLERFHEGKCVQIMHLGHPREQVATVAKLHREFLPENNLTATGFHHEIYLNDPSRVAAEKLKTVLRQPVR